MMNDIRKGVKSQTFRNWLMGSGLFAALVVSINSQDLVMGIIIIIVAAGYYGSQL